MKIKTLLAGSILFFLSCLVPLFAAEQGKITADLSALVKKINDKLAAGKGTESDLADELKAFDALLAAHPNEKTDEVAQILIVKVRVYLEVLNEAEKALPVIKKLRTDFPDAISPTEADNMIAGLEKQIEQDKIQRSLVAGAAFPDFSVKDTAGQPLSIAKYRGKIVLLDFWATWCGPCLRELPNVVKTYEQHHAKGFDIIGISLDREGDGAKLAQFTKEHGMPWAQFFDGKYWNNELARQYGVNSIPCTYLLDREGRIIGKNLVGEELSAAVAKALAAK